MLKEQLERIENELMNRPNQSVRVEKDVLREDFEERLKEYQKAIQSKSQEIRVLEERISENEVYSRKAVQ